MFLGLFICALTLIVTGLFLRSLAAEEIMVKELEKIKDIKSKLRITKFCKAVKGWANYLFCLGLTMIPLIFFAYGINLMIK